MTATGFEASTAFVPDGWTAAYARLHREGRADFPPACLFYVLNVVRHASQALQGGRAHGVGEGGQGGMPVPGERASSSGEEDVEKDATGDIPPVENLPPRGAMSPPPPVSPAALTAAFRAASRHDFGALQGEVLGDWGLIAPVDLGRAIVLLGHAGALTLDEGDTPERYGTDTCPFAGDFT